MLLSWLFRAPTEASAAFQGGVEEEVTFRLFQVKERVGLRCAV
jgi:hypothetical protein